MTENPIAFADLQLAKTALRDRRSEEMLLRRVYPRIVQIVRMAIGDRSQVDDIAQVAAMEVVRSLKSYRGEGSIEGWAGRIAWRTAMKSAKRRRARDGALMPLLNEDVPDRETPERSVSRRQLFDRFMETMTAIPEKRRLPLMLHLAFGYTVAEVSDMTGASENTVKDRLKTAFREFQSVMNEHPDLRASMLEEL